MDINFPVKITPTHALFSNCFKKLSQLDRRIQLLIRGVFVLAGFGLLIALYQKSRLCAHFDSVTPNPQQVIIPTVPTPSTKNQAFSLFEKSYEEKECLLKTLVTTNEESLKISSDIIELDKENLSSLYNESQINKEIIQQAFSLHFRLCFQELSDKNEYSEIRSFIISHPFAETEEDLVWRKKISELEERMPFTVSSERDAAVLKDFHGGLSNFCQYSCMKTNVSTCKGVFIEAIETDPSTKKPYIFSWVISENTEGMHDRIHAFTPSLLAQTDESGDTVLDHLLLNHEKHLSRLQRFDPELFDKPNEPFLCRALKFHDKTFSKLLYNFEITPKYLEKIMPAVIDSVNTSKDSMVKLNIANFLRREKVVLITSHSESKEKYIGYRNLTDNIQGFLDKTDEEIAVQDLEHLIKLTDSMRGTPPYESKEKYIGYRNLTDYIQELLDKTDEEFTVQDLEHLMKCTKFISGAPPFLTQEQQRRQERMYNNESNNPFITGSPENIFLTKLQEIQQKVEILLTKEENLKKTIYDYYDRITWVLPEEKREISDNFPRLKACENEAWLSV